MSVGGQRAGSASSASTASSNVATEISRYEYAGIDERHGVVPTWLVCVCAALVIWSIYYLLHYWQEPGIGGLGG